MANTYKSNHPYVLALLAILSVCTSIYFTLAYNGRNIMTYAPLLVLVYYLWKLCSDKILTSYEIHGDTISVTYYIKPFTKASSNFPLSNLKHEHRLKGFTRGGSKWYTLRVYDQNDDFLFQIYDDWFLWKKSDVSRIQELIDSSK